PNGIRPCGVNARVNGKGRSVHGPAAFDHLPCMVDPDQVRHLDEAEMQSKRIDPERVSELRIAGGDMPDDALVKAEFREQAERRPEPLLPVLSLLPDRRKDRRLRQIRVHLLRFGCQAFDLLDNIHRLLLLWLRTLIQAAGEFRWWRGAVSN